MADLVAAVLTENLTHYHGTAWGHRRPICGLPEATIGWFLEDETNRCPACKAAGAPATLEDQKALRVQLRQIPPRHWWSKPHPR